MDDRTAARANSIAHAVARACARTPSRVALRYADRAWSFVELDAAAGRIAAGLRETLNPGDRVGAFGQNSDAYVLLWLGCARAGLVHVPINYALTAPELRYILTQSGCALLITDPALAATAADAAPQLPRGTFEDGGGFDVLAAARAEVEPLAPAPSENDVAQIQFTSGTTAAPKGATMTHRALLAEYESCQLSLELSPRVMHVAALPFYHTAQMHCFAMPALLLNCTIAILRTAQPAAVLAALEETRAAAFFAPPTVWISLLRHPDFATRDLTALRQIFYGASTMPDPVLAELRARLPSAAPWQCYGQSEIGPLATVLRPEDHDAKPGSVGRACHNVSTRVVDLDMRDVPPGDPGEIVHRSPQLLRDYWDKPDATREAFAGGWFHSGDVGRMDSDGFLWVVDRIKDIINTGGVVVASKEVEDALFSHPAVREVAVIAVPDPKWIEAILAVVALRDGEVVDAETLMAHARKSLAPFKVPKRIEFVADLPRNSAGKLLKRTLRDAYAPR